MKKKIGGGLSLGVLLSIICLALVGCSGSSSSGGGTSTASVAVVDCSTVTSAATVTAEGTVQFSFNPDAVTIHVNDVVRWINATGVAHTVTSGIVTGGTTTTATPDGIFDQAINTLNSSVCLKFTAAGTYNYYCTHHYSMGMKGVVTVQ